MMKLQVKSKNTALWEHFGRLSVDFIVIERLQVLTPFVQAQALLLPKLPKLPGQFESH